MRSLLGGDNDAFGIRFESVLQRSGQQRAAQFDPRCLMTFRRFGARVSCGLRAFTALAPVV